jgi:predicted metal-dependent phosphoesterase TrpH
VGQRTVRVDLHSHTHRSNDSATSYRALVGACQRRGIDVIAITDHNRIEGALEFRDTIVGQRCIVGEEVRTTEGEIIGLFLTEFIPPRLSPEETIAEIKRQGGVVYMPHPFDRIRRSVIRPEALQRVAHLVDAVEVLNARLHSASQNAEALRFAQERGLLQGAGSDAHTAFEVGRAGVEMPDFEDAASFKRALASGRVFGKPSIPLVHLASSFHKYRKRYLPGWRSV